MFIFLFNFCYFDSDTNMEIDYGVFDLLLLDHMVEDLNNGDKVARPEPKKQV